MGFRDEVYFYCGKIPKGKVSTYGEIARAIGKPGSSRAVGQALKINPCPDDVPCYRVIRSNGALGGYAGSDPLQIREKENKLKKDGILVKKGKIDLDKHFFPLSDKYIYK